MGKFLLLIVGAIVFMLICLIFGVLCETVKADVAQLKGTTNTEDAWIRSGAYADNNYGGDYELEIDGDATKYFLLRPKNIASVLGAGATITGCICSLYCHTEVGGANDVYIYRVFRPWVEGDENGVDDDDGDVTWNDWASDASEWTTAGVGCANDDGVDNSADDGACDDASRRDRKATAEDNTSVDATAWYSWTIPTELAQAWYDGTANEEGILFRTTGTNWKLFYSSEYGISSYHPRFFFTYTTGAPEAGQVIIID